METRTELFWKNLSFSFTKQLLLKSDFAAEHAAELHRAEAHEWVLGASRRHPVSPRVTRCVASVWHGHRSPGTAAAGERAWRAGPPGAFGAKVLTGLERAGRGRWGLRLAPATLSGRCGGRDELPRVQRLAAPASPGNPRCHGVRGSGQGPFFKLLLPLSRRGQLREQEEGAGCSQCPPAAARTPHSPPLRVPPASLGPEANRGKTPAQLCPCGPGTSEAEAPLAG